MEDNVKRAVYRGVTDNGISSRLDRLTKCQVFALNIVGCPLKTPKFTAFIAKLVRRHAEVSVMNETELYDQATNVGKENDDGRTASPLTERSRASSASSRHDEIRKSEKKK